MAVSVGQDYIGLRRKLISTISSVLKGKSIADVLSSLDSAQDLAWMSDQLHGSLRYWGRAQWILRKYSTHKAPSGYLRRALVPAVYSILAHDRVSWVNVINETVGLIRQKEGKGPAGFANVCLRRILEQRDFWKSPDFPKEASETDQAEWASLPLWLWKQLRKERKLNELILFSEISLRPSVNWIRWIGPLPNEEQIQKLLKLGWVQSTQFKKAFFGGNPSEAIKIFPKNIYVQDITNQKIIEWIGENYPRGDIIDRCAAPGGKSISLKDLGFNPTAIDFSKERLKLITENQNRLDIHFPIFTESNWLNQVRQINGASIWVDAPCSSLGLIRRHPEIRWIRKESEVDRLRTVQKKLIQESYELIQPGQNLFYTVCSVLKKESIEHLKSLSLQGHTVKILDYFPNHESDGDGFSGFVIKKMRP
jgi:16S rRNA (cytosine967-C5)-methyltransferase